MTPFILLTLQQQGTSKGLRVAMKKLKLLADVDYDLEQAWRNEVSALEQISRVSHRHLIKPIAAIEHGKNRYIMFEWADGGSLRDLWYAKPGKADNLDKDRVMCVLEELLGLAGAVSKLHNTNTRTRTARVSQAVDADTENGAAGPSRAVRLSASGSATADDQVRSRQKRSSAMSSKTSLTLEVPQLRLPPENTVDVKGNRNSLVSDSRKVLRFESDSSVSNDNEGGDDGREEHWRHGDLKPDNILCFKDADKKRWLGTLKVADLGLAKRHMFETERRKEQTKQTYTTLQYEGPETLVNAHFPRSRRFDIWSIGCVILEFVIFLLYGKDGLDMFNNEKFHPSFDNKTETLYFSVHEGVAEVNSIAIHWINQILQDAECKDRRSAIGDLVMLVQERLLVVDVPRRGMTEDQIKNCRADAQELEQRLRRIWNRALNQKKGDYLCRFINRAEMAGPKPSERIKKRNPSRTSGQTLGAELRQTAQNLVPFPSTGTAMKNTADRSQEVRAGTQILALKIR